jgi:hypothetical protein
MQRNRELFQKWINALRSGEYKQTRQSLHDDKGYCCLGVLCDVASKENKYNMAIDEYDFEFITEEMRSTTLSSDLDGFKSVIGLTDDEELKLIHMNDGYDPDIATTVLEKQKDFNQIADYIENKILEH